MMAGTCRQPSFSSAADGGRKMTCRGGVALLPSGARSPVGDELRRFFGGVMHGTSGSPKRPRRTGGGGDGFDSTSFGDHLTLLLLLGEPADEGEDLRSAAEGDGAAAGGEAFAAAGGEAFAAAAGGAGAGADATRC